MCRLEAELHPAQSRERANHETSAGEEDDRQRELGDDERTAEAGRRTRRRRPRSSCLLERVMQSTARERQGRYETEGETREKRNYEREDEHPPIDRHLGYGLGRIRPGNSGNDRAGPERREEQSEQRGNERQDQTFGE